MNDSIGIDPLLSVFQDEIGASKLDILNYPLGSPTGIDGFDIMSMSKQIDPFGKYYVTAGIYNGSMTGFIGNTGVGKSTISQIMAASALKNELMMGRAALELFLDVEQMIELARCFNVSLFDKYSEFKKNFLRIPGQANLTTEKIAALFGKFEILKKNMKVKYEMEHPFYKGFKIPAPTFTVLDPTSRLITEEILDDAGDVANKKGEIIDTDVEMGNNVDFMTIGRKTKMMVSRIMNPMSNSNMPLIFVSHITEKKAIGKFDSKIPFLPGMSYKEKIDNGKAFSDIAYHIYRITTGKQDKDAVFGSHVEGVDKRIVVSKSKSCGELRSIPIYYDFSRGILNLLSNYRMLEESKNLSGGGGNYSISGSPTKFTKKNLYTKYFADTKFAEAFDRASYEAYLSTLHPHAGITVDEVVEYFEKYRPVGKYSNILKSNMLPVEVRRDSEKDNKSS